MIAIVDYGAGNIRSVINVLEHFKADFCLAADPQSIESACGIILPGVGAFGAAMSNLNSLNLTGAIKNAAKNGVNILGICLGQQILLDSSEESAGAKGLGIIEGEVRKLKTDGKKLPHIGWTSLEKPKGRLLEGTADGEFFYFVHSYGAHASERGAVSGTASYGETFDACIEKGNIFGCQFHPEKSGAAGKRIIENFLVICNNEGGRA